MAVYCAEQHGDHFLTLRRYDTSEEELKLGISEQNGEHCIERCAKILHDMEGHRNSHVANSAFRKELQMHPLIESSKHPIMLLSQLRGEVTEDQR